MNDLVADVQIQKVPELVGEDARLNPLPHLDLELAKLLALAWIIQLPPELNVVLIPLQNVEDLVVAL